MKIAKKIIVALLCVIMTLSVCSFPSFAASKADVAPKFQLVKISEDKNEIVAQLVLVGGNFAALDVSLKCSGNVSGCTKITQTSEFKKFVSDVEDAGKQIAKATNPATGKISISTTVAAKSTLPLYDITLSKKNADPIKEGELTVKIDNSESYLGTSTVNTTSYASCTFVFATISKTELKMNYKDTAKLEYKGSYSESNMEWKTSNPKVVSVDENGKVTATGKGTAEISIESKDGAIKATCKVTVKYSTIQWIIVYILFGWIWYVK